MTVVVGHEGVLRFAAFAAVLAVMLAWQWLKPWRNNARGTDRWIANLGLVAVDTVALRVLLPGAAIGTAVWAQAQGFGLFNAAPFAGGIAAVIAGALSFVLLDFALWLQHLATHKVPLFWRFHRVHHCDVHLDATTGVRFHPVEIVASMLYKMGVVAVLGAPAAAVVVFEIVLNASSLFNHANVRLPAAVDRLLRTVIVTPDFHRVHHSVRREETDSNYGFCLSCWDRLCGTYRPRPAAGYERMTIGLAELRDEATQRLPALLMQPFNRYP